MKAKVKHFSGDPRVLRRSKSNSSLEIAGSSADRECYVSVRFSKVSKGFVVCFGQRLLLSTSPGGEGGQEVAGRGGGGGGE